MMFQLSNVMTRSAKTFELEERVQDFYDFSCLVFIFDTKWDYFHLRWGLTLFSLPNYLIYWPIFDSYGGKLGDLNFKLKFFEVVTDFKDSDILDRFSSHFRVKIEV